MSKATEVVRTKRFELVDDNDNVVIEAGSAGDGSIEFVMRHPARPDAMISIALGADVASIYIFDGEEELFLEPRATLARR